MRIVNKIVRPIAPVPGERDTAPRRAYPFSSAIVRVVVCHHVDSYWKCSNPIPGSRGGFAKTPFEAYSARLKWALFKLTHFFASIPN